MLEIMCRKLKDRNAKAFGDRIIDYCLNQNDQEACEFLQVFTECLKLE